MTLAIIVTIASALLVLVIIEWNDPVPPSWVVKTRLWLHRRRG